MRCQTKKGGCLFGYKEKQEVNEVDEVKEVKDRNNLGTVVRDDTQEAMQQVPDALRRCSADGSDRVCDCAKLR